MTATGPAEQKVAETTAPRFAMPAWLYGDMALAVLAAFAALAVAAALGFPSLAEPGADNDSMMRLVQVRDLLAGQGWFDLHQYRMGPEGGFVMHWSRLVDAPITALILLLRPILGAAGAELAAAIVWPTALMALALFFLVGMARALGGDAARLPAVVLGATAFHFMGIFAPGALDHHNVQLTLTLAMTAWLVKGRSFAAGFAAGAAAAASLAVGMETLPYVAAAGGTVALLFWLHGEREAALSAGFGLGLAGLAALCLAHALRPAQWTATACDAFSGAQAGSAILAGIGMALVATFTGRRSRSARFVVLAALGVASIAFVLAVYPQCLAGPYADVPPRLRDYWLDWVSEAQSLLDLVHEAPAKVATSYATPLLALLLALGRLYRPTGRREAIPVTVLLAVAIAVSVWQVRGSVFSLSLAVVILSTWLGALRSRAHPAGFPIPTLKLAAAWLVSFNVAWGMAALLIFPADDDSDPRETANTCDGRADFARLAELPAGTVLAVSNHGAMILGESRHRVLSGPYHRNVEGNLTTINAMVGSPEDALPIARRYGVDYVAVCAGNPETQVLVRRAPEGLLARLERGERIDWLEPVADTEASALRIFRTLGP